jgi:hypothetical protein
MKAGSAEDGYGKRDFKIVPISLLRDSIIPARELCS